MCPFFKNMSASEYRNVNRTELALAHLHSEQNNDNTDIFKWIKYKFAT